MALAQQGKPWHEFEARGAAAAAARADEWALPAQSGCPVVCTFLGPVAAGAGKSAAEGSQVGDKPAVGLREEVRFRWTMAAPGAPPGLPLEEVVTVRADHALSRGIPVPPAWDPCLKFGAQVRRALAKAHEECPDHTCNLLGIYKGSPAALPAGSERTRPSGPRAGERWEVSHRDGSSAGVWVAAHHAAGVWWCAQALGGCLSTARRRAPRTSRVSLPRLGKPPRVFSGTRTVLLF